MKIWRGQICLLPRCVTRAVFVFPVFLFLLLTGIEAALLAGPSGTTSSGEERGDLIEVSVFSDTSSIKAGETFSIVVRFQMKKGWHIYWKNSGNAGMPTDIRVNGPDGFEFGEIQWPRPIFFKTGDIVTYGYKDQVLLFVPVTVPAALSESPFSFEVKTDYLACKDRCYMMNSKQTIKVPGDTVPDRLRSTVEKYRNAVPRPIDPGKEKFSVSWTEEGLELAGPRPSSSSDDIQFFPISVSGVELGTPDISSSEQTFRFRIPVSWNPDNHLGKERPAVRGVLAFGTDPLGPAYSFSVPLKTKR